MPKLNMSDLNDIVFLSINSGAIYPLQEIIWFEASRHNSQFQFNKRNEVQEDELTVFHKD